MSKSKKQRKARKRAQIQARRITPAKLLRLALKTLLFALVVSSVLTVMVVLDIAIVEALWFRFVLMVAGFAVAFPYVFSEFRPKV